MKQSFSGIKFSSLAIFFFTIFYNQVFAQTTWTTYSSATDTLPVVRSSAVGFSIGDTGYVVSGGGVGYNSDGHKFDKSTSTWSSIASHPGSGLDGPVGFAIGDTGYLGAGSPGGYQFPTAFYKYDPHTNTWVSIADIPAGRQLAVAFVINGKAYVGGGFSSGSYTALNDFYVYDPATGSWDTIAPCPASGVSWLAVAFSINGKGYVGTGGHQMTVGQPTFVPTTDFWSYDPSTNTWDSVARFPGGPRMGAFAFANCDKGYVGTGVDDANQQQYHSDSWEFDPATGARGTWTQITDFPGMARFKASAFVIGRDGYVCAGQNYTNNVVLGGLFKLSTVATPAFTTGNSSSPVICPGQTVSFTDTSNFNPDHWQWTFPGGTPYTSDSQNQVVTYDTAGVHDVILSVWNTCDSAYKIFSNYVTVGGSTTLTISPATPTVCPNQSVTLSVVGGGSAFKWSPGTALNKTSGDSVIATGFALLDSIVYTVTDTSGSGCPSTGHVTLRSGGGATPGIVTAIRDTICEGTAGNLSLSGNSSNTIQWQSSTDNINFTDATGDTSASYKTAPLTQTTWYRATVGSGSCSAVSNTQQLYVPPALTAYFNFIQPAGNELAFNSDSSAGSIRSYHWDFGDGQTSTDKNPEHTYTKDTTYYVCLTLYDGSNCSYTFCRYSEVTDGIPVIQASGGWMIYPNPFSNRLTIAGKQINSSIQGIELYDVLGRLVINKIPGNTTGSTQQLNVSSLATGMYYLVIRTNYADFVQKVIKQ